MTVPTTTEMTTAIIPTDNEILVPYTTLEKRSLPRSSVPNILSLEGGSKILSRLIEVGSWVAINGAKMAITTKIL